ncbi:hypothetical protein POSPLADRAFT_1032492 [Postia placenta MAD-698-R-SB12]|uniref:Uncharacterized protein n=1 Tax=Postia placenta MAD-698-R-SB12 TaxID=670580 RepID=A0A1X6N5W3_9APHY|nr:hypothetical protein POSPLADRAFT_1032492 [Postia placenta MAD-698-R-SB12]OSX64005.1 hypothetical protein POSPLADRAFT_1032492 [Postia placenta MAD-698-R-SB12]
MCPISRCRCMYTSSEASLLLLRAGTSAWRILNARARCHTAILRCCHLPSICAFLAGANASRACSPAPRTGAVRTGGIGAPRRGDRKCWRTRAGRACTHAILIKCRPRVPGLAPPIQELAGQIDWLALLHVAAGTCWLADAARALPACPWVVTADRHGCAGTGWASAHIYGERCRPDTHAHHGAGGCRGAIARRRRKWNGDQGPTRAKGAGGARMRWVPEMQMLVTDGRAGQGRAGQGRAPWLLQRLFLCNLRIWVQSNLDPGACRPQTVEFVHRSMLNYVVVWARSLSLSFPADPACCVLCGRAWGAGRECGWRWCPGIDMIIDAPGTCPDIGQRWGDRSVGSAALDGDDGDAQRYGFINQNPNLRCSTERAWPASQSRLVATAGRDGKVAGARLDLSWHDKSRDAGRRQRQDRTGGRVRAGSLKRDTRQIEGSLSTRAGQNDNRTIPRPGKTGDPSTKARVRDGPVGLAPADGRRSASVARCHDAAHASLSSWQSGRADGSGCVNVRAINRIAAVPWKRSRCDRQRDGERDAAVGGWRSHDIPPDSSVLLLLACVLGGGCRDRGRATSDGKTQTKGADTPWAGAVRRYAGGVSVLYISSRNVMIGTTGAEKWAARGQGASATDAMHLAAQGQAGSVLDEGVRDGGRDAGARQSRGVEAVGRVTGRPYASLMSMTTDRGVTQRRWRRKWGVVVESNDEDGEEAIVIFWCYRPKHTDNPDAESGSREKRGGGPMGGRGAEGVGRAGKFCGIVLEADLE